MVLFARKCSVSCQNSSEFFLGVCGLLLTIYLNCLPSEKPKMASISWWLKILLMSVVIISVSTRFIENSVGNVFEEEDVDLEDVLTDYYDELLEEFKTLHNELVLEKLKMEEAKKKEDHLEKVIRKKTDLEEKKFWNQADDLDYMSDGPSNPYSVDSSRDSKVPDSSLSDANPSWSILQPNGTIEDPALVKVQRESGLDPDAIVRSREARLVAIRKTIMELRGGSPDINSTLPSTRTIQDMLEKNKDLMPNASTNSYTEKVQSFYPSCDVPKHTDEELWTDPTYMNLLFDVTYPKAGPGTGISVLTAKLRLYKISQANITLPEPAATNINGKPEKSLLNQYGVMPGQATLEDDRLLRVSVYWYTRTLRKNRVKRKLMDSQMFNTVGGEWIEFSIRTAVRTWKESQKNYGLVVTVEDEDGVLLPAEKYVHGMNCSKDAATVKPLPSVLIDATKQYMMEHPGANQTREDISDAAEEVNPFPYPNYLFPILDVCTVEVPVQESESYKGNSNPSTGYSMMVARNDRNMTNKTKSGSFRRNDDVRTTLFNTVGLGSPASGQNRNNLVPILTKSDVVAIPEDVRMKNELLKVQNDGPRRRHSRKHAPNHNK